MKTQRCIERLNDNTVLIHVTEQTQQAQLCTIAAIADRVQSQLKPHIRNCVPASTSVMIEMNDLTIRYAPFRLSLEKLLEDLSRTLTQPATAIQGAQHRLPVYYHPSVGPDLKTIATAKNIHVDELIQRHYSRSYLVTAVGFTPGFAYMGSVDPSIAMARKHSPRALVPKGSVGIADTQTGIYPRQSPGGWNIIGHCPQTLLKPINQLVPKTERYCSLTVGDTVSFYPLSRSEYLDLLAELQ